MTPDPANMPAADPSAANGATAVPYFDDFTDAEVARQPTRLAVLILDAVEFIGDFLRDDVDSSGPHEWWRISALLQLDLAADELERAGAPPVSEGTLVTTPKVSEVLGHVDVTLRNVGRELAAQPLSFYDNETDPYSLLALARAMLHLDAARQLAAAATAGRPAGSAAAR